MRTIRVVSAICVATTALAFAAIPASADAPTVSATPDKQLVDGQTVMVSVSGFAANTEIAIIECPTTTVSPTVCSADELGFATTDATGAFTDAPFTVARVLSDGTDCALNGGCYIGTQDAEAVGPTASTRIRFDPKVPPLTLTVRLDKTGFVNAKGVVTLQGTLRCNGGASGADAEVQVDLRQVVDRAIFEAFGFFQAFCPDHAAHPFRVTIRPQNGFFGPGAASARVSANSGSTFVTHKVAETLQSR